MIEVNKYQTKLTDELLSKLNSEVREELLGAISSISFIRNLISPKRLYAKDLPKDCDGKILVNITNPHILENMDYFRPSAIHYKKYGCYTKLKPNGNPNSEYGKWIREEKRRCWEGYVRKSDGEWVTGALYWYLNYCPIMLVKETGESTGERIFDFPEMWEGVYWRFHYYHQARLRGEMCAEIASRGKSKSYSYGGISSHNFILGINKEAHENTTTLVVANEREALMKDGTLNKFIDVIDWCAENTQFPRLRLKESNQSMTWIMGYRDLDMGIDKGTKNKVMGVTIKDNIGKIRGKRAAYILIEEAGTFPNLEQLYNILIPSVKEGRFSFGQMILVGTAGDKNSDFEGFKKIIYNPKAYSMHALQNVWDKSSQGKQEFVFFFPSYVNLKGHYNKDGVSDVIGALIEILEERHKRKYNSEDSKTLLRYIAEYPITPSEAVVKYDKNIFPVNDINNRILQLQNNQELNESIIGKLELKDGKVTIKPTNDKPIHTFPHTDNHIAGAVEIFAMPEKDKNDNVYGFRYILGCDPYDNDQADSVSLGSVFVLDMFTDKIVAEYTGRPMFADDFYEIVRRLCIFYNGTCLYENNKKGLFTYFQKMNSLYYLSDSPQTLRDKDIIKNTSFGNSAKGVNATKGVNSYARMLLRDWLLMPITTTVIENNVEKEITFYNLNYIRSISLLLELSMWNEIGNFDRVSAMGMLMLMREERMATFQNGAKQEISEDYLGNDKFFTKNYKRNKNKSTY